MSDLEEYVGLLDCADEADRMYAASDIGYLNVPEGVAPLLNRLDREPSRPVRDAIFQALSRIESEAAIEGSLRLLKSEEPQIRNQTVEMLHRKGPQALPYLRSAMREGNGDMRKLILDALSGFDSMDARVIYDEALSDQDLNVVITAVECLGRTRAVQFKRQIEDLFVTGSHPMLVGACLEALGSLGDEQSLAVIRTRFPNLAVLPDFYLGPCLMAIGALGSAGDFAAVASLLRSCQARLCPSILGALVSLHQRHPAQSCDEELVSALQSMVADTEPPLNRYQAVRALGVLSSRDEVRSFLVSCLQSAERLVRLGAVESLRKSGRPDIETILALRSREESDAEVQQALSC